MAVGDYDIIVCGDSFCCASTIELKMVGLRAHFSQILEDLYGYRVLNLAHGGVSNVCTLWQIREAVKLRPRAIVYNRTFEGRFDLMRNDLFEVNRGLRNWAYWVPDTLSYDTPYTSRINDIKVSPSVISSVVDGAAENRYLNLTDQEMAAIESWQLHFFNWEMLAEMNNWHFEYWHDRMEKTGIQALPLRNDKVGRVAWAFSQKNLDYDSPFHTDRATQEQVAENIHLLVQSGERLEWEPWVWFPEN